MTEFLHWLWQATLAGSGAIVLTLIFMPLLRRTLGARAAFPAWAFALGLLLSPWDIRSPVSVLPAASDLPPAVVQVVVTRHASPPVPQGFPKPADASFPWAFTIWAVGATGSLTVFFLRVARTHRLVKSSRSITPDFPGLPCLMPARVRVRESADIRSPAMCGLFHPVILLPLGWKNERNLNWILLHEIGHIRRGDLLWRWAFQIVRALHWFNPLVWLAERAARIDQEMACDEWVLARGGAGNGPAYGEAILLAASQPASQWPIQAGMAESKSGLSRRIRHLVTAHPRGFWTVAITLILGVAALLLFSPGGPENEPPPQIVFSRPEPSSPTGPSVHVEIESKFVEVSPEIAEEVFGSGRAKSQTILSAEEFQNLLRSLNQREGVDLVSAPKVTAKIGQRATVQIVREFRYPTEFKLSDSPEVSQGNNTSPVKLMIPPTPTTFETQFIGIILEAESSLATDNRIICSLSPRVVEFLGFVNYGASAPDLSDPADDAIDAALRPIANVGEVINQPIFRTREMQTTVILRSGQTVLLGGLSRTDKQALGTLSVPPEQDTKDVERVLYVFVTLRSLDAAGLAFSAEAAAKLRASSTSQPNAPSPVPAARADLPYGTPVPNKPGFVTSPHAPYDGYVDLRGFPPGTEVKCPYTGKLFLVP